MKFFDYGLSIAYLTIGNRLWGISKNNAYVIRWIKPIQMLFGLFHCAPTPLYQQIIFPTFSLTIKKQFSLKLNYISNTNDSFWLKNESLIKLNLRHLKFSKTSLAIIQSFFFSYTHFVTFAHFYFFLFGVGVCQLTWVIFLNARI